MKHLKIFESFGSDDEYYTIIEEDEWDKYIDISHIDIITDKISNQIINKALSYIKERVENVEEDLPKFRYIDTTGNSRTFLNVLYKWNKGESTIEFRGSDSGLDINFYSKTPSKPNKGISYVCGWNIILLKDEWFIVCLTDVDYFGSRECTYFKCDQWEGLVRLFNDSLEPQIESMS